MFEKQLWELSAVEIAKDIKNLKISCYDVVSSSIERLNEVNPKLNAVVIDVSEQALEQSILADLKVQSGSKLGILHGVPVTIKNNVDVAGQPTTYGVKNFLNHIPKKNAIVVNNLLKAGAIIIGITNTSEFSMSPITNNPLYGLTLNPWNPNYICGGSSGGAASSVVSGIGCIGHGNDIGGSLRIPSFCCGVPSIKPTLGRVPSTGATVLNNVALASQLFTVQGPIAREVKDLRLALEAMSSYGNTDPWWVPTPLIGSKLKKPIKVAVSKNFNCDPTISNAISLASEYLEGEGYETYDIEAPFSDELGDLWKSIVYTDICYFYEEDYKKYGSIEFYNRFIEYYNNIKFLDKNEYMKAMSRRFIILQKWLIFLEKYPLVIAPLSLKSSFKTNKNYSTDELFSSLKPSLSVNVLGLPSISVPIGINQGVPYGVQIIGQKFREDMCFDAAEKIEKQVGILSKKLWNK